MSYSSTLVRLFSPSGPNPKTSCLDSIHYLTLILRALYNHPHSSLAAHHCPDRTPEGEGKLHTMDQYAHIVALADYLCPQTRSLPELPQVEVLTPRVLRVLGGNPGQVSSARVSTLPPWQGQNMLTHCADATPGHQHIHSWHGPREATDRHWARQRTLGGINRVFD